MERHASGQATLGQLAIASCRQRLRRTKISDSTGASLTGGELLARALVLRRLLRRAVLAEDEQYVGILLPPSAAAAATNLALTLDGRIVVNLNYTLTSELLNSCIRQAGVRHVVTSRRVLDRLAVAIAAETVLLEEIRDQVSRRDKLVGAAMAYGLPSTIIARALRVDRRRETDAASVMFTSGTTGDPKGAVLTHRNIRFNIHAVDQVIRLKRDDVVLGVLPFFHSFGFAITLWTVLALDVAAAYHVNPLEAQTVGRLCRQHKGTILLATPWFVRTYTRRCDPEDFASLEVLVTGAEKLPPTVADAFEEKFGLRPVEGYGTTETSPLISANVPPRRAIGDPTQSAREGTVGKPAPGVQVKLVDVGTGEPVPPGERGMLLVSGPNVMHSYLDRPDATADAVRDGWYVTGDVCTIDEDGFITIVGRESRFAKIGGEMVPHGLVEDALTEIVGVNEDGGPRVVVLSVPDPDRGERLVVVHAELGQTPERALAQLKQRGLPNLYLPSADSFLKVDELPMLGVGKLDLRRIAQLARDAFGSTG